MNVKVGNWLLAAILCLLSVNLMAQTEDETRQLVKLHKEAFFDIRIMKSSQASHIAEEVAEFMKTHEDVAITVIGYADRETGNPSLNIFYARGRAENFRRDLVERYGVDPNRISIDYKGDRVQPFTENARNRCVIIDGYGYVPNSGEMMITPVRNSTAARPSTAAVQANAQRQQYYDTKAAQYADEMNKHSKDTIYVSHRDTLWVVHVRDTTKKERAFGVSREHLWHNWFITVSGGPAIFQGDHNVDAAWKDRIFPAFDLSIGKWILPALGVRVGANLDMVHSYYNANASSPNPLAWYYGEFVHGASPKEPYDEAPWLYKMRYNSWNFHADVMVNFSSFMWRPYNRRFWNLIGYAGVGWVAKWDNGERDWYNDAISWNVGILNSFRVAEHLDINLDLRLKQFDDDYNCFRQGRGLDGITNLMIGFTWHFTKRGF